MPLTTTLAGGSALIKWLLRDEFTDTRAAGAVNGTPATPGPGARTVADAGNRMTVGAGLFSVAGGANDSTDYLRYAQVTRASGRILICENVNAPNTAGGRHHVAWSVNAGNSNSLVGYVFLSGGTLGIMLNTAGNGAGAISVATYANGEDVDVDVILRAAGAYYMRHSSGVWVLDYVYSAGVNDLYPRTSGGKAYSVDAIRLPDELYLPTPLAYDTFTRANGALGSSEAAGPDGQTAPVHAWNNRVGTTQIAGNVASASALVGGIAIATVDTAASPDTIVQGTLTRAGNEVGVILRYVDADNYIRAVHDGTNCQLIKRVATAETTVITAAVAIGAGQIAVVPEGTAFSLYLNNAQVGATSAIADAALQTGTEQGLYSTNVGNTQDLFWVMPRGTNGEYNRLNRWSA